MLNPGVNAERISSVALQNPSTFDTSQNSNCRCMQVFDFHILFISVRISELSSFYHAHLKDSYFPVVLSQPCLPLNLYTQTASRPPTRSATTPPTLQALASTDQRWMSGVFMTRLLYCSVQSGPAYHAFALVFLSVCECVRRDECVSLL